MIFLGLGGVDAVEGWMGALLHRIPLMQSRLRKVGYGSAAGGPAKITVVLDALNGMGPGKDASVVVYPADDQKDVPTDFSPEIPDPIPESTDKKAGYPATAIFAEGALVKDVKASLKDPAGNDVAVLALDPGEARRRRLPEEHGRAHPESAAPARDRLHGHDRRRGAGEAVAADVDVYHRRPVIPGPGRAYRGSP